MILSTATKPFSDKLSLLYKTESVLNKFVYATGMDANDIGDLVHKAIEKAGSDLMVLENDFKCFDAS
jgi:hypothetical protein